MPDPSAPDLDLAIVGGGIAGLTAGLVAARAGLHVAVFDRMGPGGQLINVDRVENYPGFPSGIAGYELGPATLEQATAAGMKIEYAEVHALARDGTYWQLNTDRGEIRAAAVIVASGSELAKLGLEGETKLHGHGLSYCATCDAEFFRDQPVAVIGGGDSALDETLVLAPVASSVTVITREALSGAQIGIDRVGALDNVSVRPETTVTALHGTDELEGISVAPAAGGDPERLDVSGVFVYVGLEANTSLLEGLVALDPAGHVEVDAMMATAQPGLFVAGDLRAGSVRLLVSCAGDGATAAVAAERYIRTLSK